jgi:adenine-specific DNA-methyltransferase
MTGELLAQAERVRVTSTASLDPLTQSRLGQFFTPERAAALIAAMPVLPSGSALRILDPGAGSGMLMAALIERIGTERPGTAVSVTSVEVDPEVIPALTETAHLCKAWGKKRGISVSVDIRRHDLITASTGLADDLAAEFDVVIMNPPYAKLASASHERRAMAALGVDCPNLYAAFLAVGVQALRPGGQLVAITPRSFANGPYFGNFRSYFFNSITINRLHVFESRSRVFADTGVLQENIIFSGVKAGERSPVRITTSRDHEDVATEHVIGYQDLVLPSDPHKFLRIPTTDSDTAIAERMMNLPSTLESLGVQISTGRVVEFRAQKNVRTTPSQGDVPLIYPTNLRSGRVEWPRKTRKPQGFSVLSDADRKVLLPPGHYVLVKRFSAKEERRRVVAALWDPGRNGTCEVAFENHLNFFHSRGVGLNPRLAWGLCLWLNGSPVDQFFRTFSGHTQVNATDLRSLRFPSAQDLCELAATCDELPEQESLDLLIDGVDKKKVAA